MPLTRGIFYFMRICESLWTFIAVYAHLYRFIRFYHDLWTSVRSYALLEEFMRS